MNFVDDRFFDTLADFIKKEVQCAINQVSVNTNVSYTNKDDDLFCETFDGKFLFKRDS